MEEAIVLFPPPGVHSHLVPMIELANLILTHHPTFSITIFLLKPPPNSSNQYLAAAAAATKSITLHAFPPIPDHDIPPNLSPLELLFELPRLHSSNIRKTLQALSEKTKLKAFIIDFFCYGALEVSKSLSIPTYYFFTTSGSGLNFFLYLPTLDRESGKSFKDMESPVSAPGLPPIPTPDIPSTLQDRTARIFKYFFETAIHMAESSGIIVNTFESLEETSLKALRDGLCVPEKPTPPIFYVGPIVLKSSDNGDGGKQEYCLSWLDQQPSNSVVFLCFGSMGLFSAKQLFEMAVGLEKSGQRFLWVVRDPPGDGDQERSLDEVLPKGFLERTKERGLVVRKWAPQVKILSHDSVGGFVTHCGWSSVLESICAGVPMVAWPLYAEQRLNRVFLVEEMRIALALNDSGDGGLVSGAELEERVRELMGSESERGREVRERVLMMRDAAVNAMGSGGSSRLALTKLTEQWKKNSALIN
ncbi:Anthocyanidin 5,3-O-glucosyltransferase [Morus notabilis]|uniref:Glycosyltransferase n=1 Tax=Morus notabilis TaxID=981085 RepID=W9RSG0_9ROSA|nr:anthocyanidin 5,3-O-glucosyltransferase [Morus notabilis]EXC05944.1 Anthocyanidin 5,3-O-glucosyltransferase [Morus notabilis]